MKRWATSTLSKLLSLSLLILSNLKGCILEAAKTEVQYHKQGDDVNLVMSHDDGNALKRDFMQEYNGRIKELIKEGMQKRPIQDHRNNEYPPQYHLVMPTGKKDALQIKTKPSDILYYAQNNKKSLMSNRGENFGETDKDYHDDMSKMMIAKVNEGTAMVSTNSDIAAGNRRNTGKEWYTNGPNIDFQKYSLAQRYDARNSIYNRQRKLPKINILQVQNPYQRTRKLVEADNPTTSTEDGQGIDEDTSIRSIIKGTNKRERNKKKDSKSSSGKKEKSSSSDSGSGSSDSRKRSKSSDSKKGKKHKQDSSSSGKKGFVHPPLHEGKKEEDYNPHGKKKEISSSSEKTGIVDKESDDDNNEYYNDYEEIADSKEQSQEDASPLLGKSEKQPSNSTVKDGNAVDGSNVHLTGNEGVVANNTETQQQGKEKEEKIAEAMEEDKEAIGQYQYTDEVDDKEGYEESNRRIR